MLLFHKTFREGEAKGCFAMFGCAAYYHDLPLTEAVQAGIKRGYPHASFKCWAVLNSFFNFFNLFFYGNYFIFVHIPLLVILFLSVPKLKPCSWRNLEELYSSHKARHSSFTLSQPKA